jgi:para-aminobenzoate synthetase component 1
VFGYFTYDLKNEIENLSSDKLDRLHFPKVHFFRPRYLIAIPAYQNKLCIYYDPDLDTTEGINQLYQELILNNIPQVSTLNFPIHQRTNRETYIHTVNEIKKHLQHGDIYEMNYCQEFYSEQVVINPAAVYQNLNSHSPMPFSCFYKTKEFYLMCASPERFLMRTKNKIISQPIKGTCRRGETQEEDNELSKQLASNTKERSENIMIVDLVRNDLSRTALRGSVQVEELCKVYPFKALHQMISTIVSEVDSATLSTNVIRAAFPMGSMTGAPKVRAMQLIEQFEETKRGLYSGSVGYFTPEGDFDLNVVIRSILYNKKEKYLSFSAGSAITTSSDPEHEYNECLLKAATMIRALNNE